MKNNEELQKDVQDAIKWEPLLKAAEIGVIAKDGIITLTGTVDSFFKKTEAEDAAKKVMGVKAVVEKIDVNFHALGKTNDSDIASSVINTLKWNWAIPQDKITIKVEKGRVTLEGDLEWDYQREAVKTAVAKLTGVTAVINNISIKSEMQDELEKKEVEHALARNWSLNDRDIRVEASGTTIKLTGVVFSSYQKDEAGRIAWNTPGVNLVSNELVIEYDYAMQD